jgi:chemotaxis protein methyltransferase CheR
MSAALGEVARMIERESGIVLKPAQLPSLQDAIARVDRDLTAEDLLVQEVSPETLERLIDEITIRETFFFRHRSELDAIDWYAALDAARARGSDAVRVWVAGCASGEEAYTVAILACEAFASASPPVRVLASDIAPTALEQARAGRYGKRAMRNLQAGVRERYFTIEDRVVSVGERLRALVELCRHNLVRDPAPASGPFDVILCRNVLIYFDRPTVELVLKTLEGALAPAGLLLLGAADRLSGQGRPVAQARPRTVPRISRVDASARTQPAQLPVQRRQAGASDERPAKDNRAGKATRQAPTTAAEAMKAADRGELDLAVRIARDVLAEDPLNCEAHFIRGVAELARGDARAAVEPLRRALYIDPNFGLAAFKLAGAHDALGELEPARRAYERTLRTLGHCATEQTKRSEQRDLVEIATACHARLRALADARGPTPQPAIYRDANPTSASRSGRGVTGRAG